MKKIANLVERLKNGPALLDKIKKILKIALEILNLIAIIKTLFF